jgi:hypothetical protein
VGLCVEVEASGLSASLRVAFRSCSSPAISIADVPLRFPEAKVQLDSGWHASYISTIFLPAASHE